MDRVINTQTLGRRLCWLRETAQQSQAVVAQVCGVTKLTVYRWEHDHKRPSRTHLKALAVHFNVSTRFLRSGEKTCTFVAVTEEEFMLLEAFARLSPPDRRDLLNLLKGYP